MNEQAKDFESGAEEGGVEKLGQLTDFFIDQIRKLAALHEEGILTDGEFVTKKTELLSRI